MGFFNFRGKKNNESKKKSGSVKKQIMQIVEYIMSKPNILLIVVDSLRSDKCYSQKKSSVTPTIDMLIKNGVYFEQAISSAASTILSVGSLLTGLYPFRIGLGGTAYQKLDPKITNLVKILIFYLEVLSPFQFV